MASLPKRVAIHETNGLSLANTTLPRTRSRSQKSRHKSEAWNAGSLGGKLLAFQLRFALKMRESGMRKNREIQSLSATEIGGLRHRRKLFTNQLPGGGTQRRWLSLAPISFWLLLLGLVHFLSVSRCEFQLRAPRMQEGGGGGDHRNCFRQQASLQC